MGIIRRIKQIKGVKQFVYRPKIRRIHRKIESAYRKYVHWLSTRGTKSIDSAVNTQADRSEMYIITIAFNTEILIEKQIELIKQVEINIDYILELIAKKYGKDKVYDGPTLEELLSKAIGSSPALRNKRDLIDAFVKRYSPDKEIGVFFGYILELTGWRAVGCGLPHHRQRGQSAVAV